jgi:hypothetical protein
VSPYKEVYGWLTDGVRKVYGSTAFGQCSTSSGFHYTYIALSAKGEPGRDSGTGPRLVSPARRAGRKKFHPPPKIRFGAQSEGQKHPPDGPICQKLVLTLYEIL